MNTIMLCNTSMWMGKSETVDKLGVALVCTWIWNQYYVWHLTAVGSGLIEEYNISLRWALIRDCLCTCVTITFLAHIPALFPSALTVWGVGPPAAPAAHHATPTRVVTHPASHPQGKENGTSMLRLQHSSIYEWMFLFKNHWLSGKGGGTLGQTCALSLLLLCDFHFLCLF